jgi:hypothetical protein
MFREIKRRFRYCIYMFRDMDRKQILNIYIRDATQRCRYYKYMFRHVTEGIDTKYTYYRCI